MTAAAGGIIGASAGLREVLERAEDIAILADFELPGSGSEFLRTALEGGYEDTNKTLQRSRRPPPWPRITVAPS